MFPFLKRHASLLALLAVLAAAVAAPYMLPEDPDSAVFRSGALSALLLAAGFFPVREAFFRAGLSREARRALAGGLLWGFLLACALSLGAELAFYDELLPGLGSAVRRAAVPLLAAPLLGGLAARVLSASPAGSSQACRARRVPWWAFAALLLVCWLPVWLAHFPAMLNYDFESEYLQYPDSVYKTAHPMLYSVLQRALLDLGARLVSPTFGLLLTTLFRLLFLSATLGCACAFCARRGAPPLALAALTAFFALHPIFPVMAVSTNKDVPFACSLTLLTLLSWRALERGGRFSARGALAFALLSVLTFHLRKNGVFALVFLFPALLLAARGNRARTLALLAASAAACALVSAGLYAWLKPLLQNDAHLFSLPAQQLVRAYNYGEMSDADRAELEAWYVYPSGLEVHPHNADRAKNNLDHVRFDADHSDYLALWARVGRENPKEYLDAFLLLNMGLWYPDDETHLSVYEGISYGASGYLQGEMYDPANYGYELTCYLPAVREAIDRVREGAYRRVPLLPLLFSTATPFWLLLLAAARLAARGNARFIPALFGALGIWFSYLLGPCTLARYVLPLFLIAPAALTAAFFQPGKEARA